MAGLASLLPRFVALPLVALFGTATLTFAANSQLTSPSAPAKPAAAALPTVMVVPDVRRQAFVFAKGTLEDAGFTLRVVRRDGEDLPSTMDFLDNRVNVAVETQDDGTEVVTEVVSVG